jgi:hypothetical protein
MGEVKKAHERHWILISAISARPRSGPKFPLDRSRSVLSCAVIRAGKCPHFATRSQPLRNGSSKKSLGKTQKAAIKGKRIRQSRPLNFKQEAWYQHAQQAIGVAVRASQGA